VQRCSVLYVLFVLGWLLIAEKSKLGKERNGDLHQILVLLLVYVRGEKPLQSYRLAVVLGPRVVLPHYGVREVRLLPLRRRAAPRRQGRGTGRVAWHWKAWVRRIQKHVVKTVASAWVR